jgi:hypothetical protein
MILRRRPNNKCFANTKSGITTGAENRHSIRTVSKRFCEHHRNGGVAPLCPVQEGFQQDALGAASAVAQVARWSLP